MSGGQSSFQHEALFYGGEEEFLTGTLPFIEQGLKAGEPVLVAVSEAKIGLISAKLNGRPDAVRFADVREMGRNPACLIPAWREFVGNNAVAGRGVRGIGEPMWADRGPAEIVECEHHESLLNLAFADAPAWRLRCPYDAAALDTSVLEAAARSHPVIIEDGVARESASYLAPGDAPDPLDDPLPGPSREPDETSFTLEDLSELRSFVYQRARSGGLDPERTANILLATSEVATNSVRHAGGRGTLRVWREPDALLCEVHDSGSIVSPLVGLERPGPSQLEGRGLWLVNQLCDLVQVRSTPSGSVVRLHMRPD